jgi:hypothetical protein
MSLKRAGGLKRKIELSALEPRMLFDGAGLAVWDAGTVPVESPPPAADAAAEAAQPAGTGATELVFLSPEVANPEAIRSAFGAGYEIIGLAATRDGIDQISEALAARHGVSAVHLVSHGAADAIALPGQALSVATLEARAAQIALWSAALTADADILVYGCDVAATEGGVTLLGKLAAITGADVAGSTNDTGGTAGADWTLEYHSGAIEAAALYSPGLGDPASYANRLATINLSGATGWTTIMIGAGRDPFNDSQAGAADTDIIGDLTHGSLYTAYDDNGTATVADDTLAFRMRIDNPTSTSNFGGVAIVGMDANLDGKVDLFISVDGRNNGQAVRLLEPGTGVNLSPSTTSTSALPTGWLPNNGVYAFSSTTYSVVPVSAASDPNWGPSSLGGAGSAANNLTGQGGADAFISWRVPIIDIATVLAKPSPTGRDGTGPRGSTGLSGFTKDTVVQYISFTQTQTGPINGDLNGVGANYDRNATFASLGAFTAPMSPSNPVPDGLSIVVGEPVGDGLLAGAPGSSEASSVTLNGGTKASVGSLVNLTVTDSAAGSVSASATVVAGANGYNSWSVGGVNLSALAEGTLTISASVVNGSLSASDTASVMLDKSAPLVGINQLAGTTAGKPTFTGSANLADGAVVTLTLDSDNNAATANLVYQAIVSGGAWTVNTATATALSGALPAGALSAATKVTATASDAAGNLATAVALNRPSITSLVTAATLPTIGGVWTSVAGDTLTVRIYANSGGAQGALLASYVPASSGDAWSVNLASATEVGGGTLGALATGTYHIEASVTRGGATVADVTSGELSIIGGVSIDIVDSDGVDDDVVTTGSAKPVFSGSSSVSNGTISVTLDPAGNGTADQIRYAVATDASGAWTLDTGSAAVQPVAGLMPYAGLSGALLVTASTAPDASGMSASDTQNVNVVIPTIMIGTSASDKSGIVTTVQDGGAAANIIVGDGIFNVAEDDAVVVSGRTTNIAQGAQVAIRISDGINFIDRTALVAADGSFSNAGNAFNLSSLSDTGLTVTVTAASVSAQKTVLHDTIAPEIVLTTPSLLKSGAAVATGNVGLPAGSVISVATSLAPTSFTTVTADANGDFALNFNLPNPGGNTGANVTIYAKSSATDLSGNKVVDVNQTVTYKNGQANPPSIAIGSITGVNGTDTTITSAEIIPSVTISGAVANTSSVGGGTVVVRIAADNVTLTPTVTRIGNNWSVTLLESALKALYNGTLVVTAELTDDFGQGGNVEHFVVRDASQPILFLVTGTPSISINNPIDANGLINATEDNAVTITGHAVNAVGGKVSVTVSDGDNATVDPTALATVNSDGSWSASVMDLSALNDGTLTVTASVDPDASATTSNSVSTSATVMHDKSAPVINITAGASAGTATPVITGTSSGLSVGASVTVSVDSDRDGVVDQTYTTTILDGGVWHVAAASTPVNSIIVARAADTAGNQASVTATAIYALSSDTGSSSTDFVTSTRQLTFTGYAEAGKSVDLQLGNTVIGSASADAVTGAWSFNHAATSLANGSYVLTATTLVGGNRAVSTQTIIVDAKSVAITGITQDSGASATDYRTADATLAFSGTASAGVPVTVYLAGSDGAEVFRQVSTASGGVWSLDRSAAAALPDGAYTLYAAVTDASGMTTTVSQALSVDTRAQIGITTNYRTPDTTPVLTGTTDIEAGRSITVHVAVSGGASYDYLTSVSASGTFSVDTGVAVPAGGNAPASFANGAVLTITASGSDIAGNSGTASKTMLVDVAAPAISITTALDYTGANTPNGILLASEDTGVILRGVASGVADGGMIALTITDGTITLADSAVVTAGVWQLSPLNLRNLANGTITVSATYYDDGGTAFGAVATVVHDKSVSGTSVSIDSISTDTAIATDFTTSDNTLQLRGSAAPGAQVKLILTGAGVTLFTTTAIADAGGNWTYDYQATPLADGAYSLSAQVGAGTLATQTIGIDTTTPAGAVSVDPPVVTDDTTPQLTGQAVLAAGETLSVTVNGKTYIAGDGKLTLAGANWTLAIPASDALTAGSGAAGFDGVYQVVATITDAAGNTRSDSSVDELTVRDIAAPVIDLAPADGATVDRSVSSANGAAVSLDDGADPLTLVEAGDRLSRLTIGVAGLSGNDGASEKLVFGITVLAADGSDAGALALSDVVVGGVRVNISYANGVFTLQHYNFVTLSAAQSQSVLRDIGYRNDRGALSTSSVKTFTFGARDDAGNQAAGARAFVTVSGSVAAPSQSVTIAAITDDVAAVTGTVASGGYTNDTTPGLSGGISGALGANESVAIYRDGVRLGTATVIGTSWSYADSGLADEASYSYTAKVEDGVTSASGTVSAAYVIIVDASAPAQVVTIEAMSKDSGTAGDFVTADGSAGRSISGSLSAVMGAGEVLEVSVDGVSWNPATVSGTAWSVTDSAGHAGNWTISTRITDAAGNVGGAASELVTLQAAPAQVALVTAAADDVAPVSGNVADGGVTNDSAPVVSGTISAALGANEVLALYRNGVRVGDASINGVAWSFADSGLLDGATYSYAAVVENTVTGASGALSSAYSVSVDTSAPAQVVTIDAMTKDSGAAGDFVTADGSAGRGVTGSLSAALGAGEVLEVSVDGASWNAASVSGTAWSITDSASHGGSWNIATRLIDAAGNTGGAANQVVTLTTAPAQVAMVTSVSDDVAALTGNVAHGGVTNDAAPVVSGTISAPLATGEALAVYRNGIRVGTASVNGAAWRFADSGLLDGATYSYTALVENTVAGTSGLVSAAYAFTVDTSAPTQDVVIVAISRDSGIDGDFITADGTAGRSVHGTLSAAIAQGEVLELSFDGGIDWVAAVVSGIEWTAIDNAMHSSSWTIVARITDGAGNVGGTATRDVMWVATPQQVAVITAITDDAGTVTGHVSHGGVTDDRAPVVSGTVTAPLAANEVLAVYRNAARVGIASVSGTAWHFADAGLSDGASYSYTVQVENTLAGARGAVSAAYSMTVDASAPAQVVSIVAMTRDSGVAGDFITADGGAGRSIAGTLSAPLLAGETLELSFDNGATWLAAEVGGTDWSAVDLNAHSASWSISSRITDAAGNVGGAGARAVTLARPPGQVNITAVIDDVAGVTGTIVNGGASNDASPLVSGSLSSPALTGERVAVYRDGEKIGIASITGGSWTFQDAGLADGARVQYQARVENTLTAAVGELSQAYTVNIDASAPTQGVSVLAMSKDTGATGDFVTSDGSAGRTLDGSLSAPLASGEVLEVSSDGGASWRMATVSGTAWQAIDGSAHPGSWTIATRVVDAAGNTGAIATRAVVLAAEQLFPQADPLPTPEPVFEAPVQVALTPVAPDAFVPAPGVITDTVGDPVNASAPAASSDLGPGAPLVSTGIPRPDLATANLVLLEGPAPSRFFEIDTGANAIGAAGAPLVLSGSDIGAGFAINVRQEAGLADAKDGLRLVQALVQIETGLRPESDLLALSITSPNITAVYDAASGTLTLSGIASAAEYEQVIQGVKLRDLTGADVKSKRTIRFTIRAESGQTQNGTKEYRGPEAVPDAPRGTTERGIPVTETARPGKSGLLAQLAKAQARQTEGRDRLLSLAGARQRG